MAHSREGNKKNDCHNILFSSAGLKNDGEHLRRMFLLDYVGLCWYVLAAGPPKGPASNPKVRILWDLEFFVSKTHKLRANKTFTIRSWEITAIVGSSEMGKRMTAFWRCAGDGWDDFDLEDSKPKVAEMAGATSAQVCTGRGFETHLCWIVVHFMLSLPYFGQRISNDINVTSNDRQIGRGIIPKCTIFQVFSASRVTI